jgi:isochorismate synthase EntC
VCGTPRERALALIDEHEPFDRGWYAGLQGWFDAAGQGEFYVALRSGLIRQKEVSLYAGAGLVEGSDPDREAAETSLKLSSLREALELNCAT